MIKYNKLYWILPAVLFIPQLVMTLNSFNQMRFEELIESVQSVYWFDQRQILSGIHVNVGWYGLLLLVYKLFGFSLNSGRIVYLVASLISSFVLAKLLRKFFKPLIAGLILTTIVLSPTYVYMNSLSLHWAMTFHLLIIILALLNWLDFSKKRTSLVLTALIFLLMMLAWFFYQAFVFYIPSLIIFYIWKRSHLRGVKAHPGGVMLAAVAFLLPVVMLFAYVVNKQMLIYDAQTQSGLFRGGGRLTFSGDVFAQAWTDFISDFFIRGVSHHYEVAQAEFSLIFPILTLVFVFYAMRKIWRKAKSARLLIFLALLVICFDIVIFSFTSDLGLPGMKRLTPMLASIYFLWVICWYYISNLKFKIKNLKLFGMGILSILLIHHLIVYPANLAAIKDHSPFKDLSWFNTSGNPKDSLNQMLNVLQKQDLKLDCRPFVNQLGSCGYYFIYPALALSCKYNHLNCHNILGYDKINQTFIPLSIKLWQEGYLE